MSDLSEHYRILSEKFEKERNWFKGLCFDSWANMRGQTKGLQRQRRLIRRLQAALALERATKLALTNGCSVHGECPYCRANSLVGDPRIAVTGSSLPGAFTNDAEGQSR